MLNRLSQAKSSTAGLSQTKSRLLSGKNNKILFWGLLFLLIIARASISEKITTKSLYDFDEARYAEIAKNVINSKQILIPLAGGPDDPQHIDISLPDQTIVHPYFWKPPLHPLIIAINFRLFGVNELSVRLSSLIFALGSLLLVFKITRKLFPRHPITPYLSIILLASSNDFSVLSSQGIAETQFLFFSLLTIYFLLKKHHFKNILLSGFFLSLAFFTKSFATFWIFPLSFFLFIKHKTKLSKIISFYLFFLILILPWHIFMILKFGQDFITGYIVNNTIGRATGEQQNIAPVYWYLKYASQYWKYYLLPLILLPFSLPKIPKKDYPKILFFLLWAILIFIPYSLIKSKVWWYIFPFWIPTITLLSYLIETQIKHKPAKIILFALLPFILLINLHSLNQAQYRTDFNLGIKLIAQTTKQNISNLSSFLIPYEAPLFYLNSHTIQYQITDNTQYLITNIDHIDKLDPKKWQIINQQEKTFLLKKIDKISP